MPNQACYRDPLKMRGLRSMVKLASLLLAAVALYPVSFQNAKPGAVVAQQPKPPDARPAPQKPDSHQPASHEPPQGEDKGDAQAPVQQQAAYGKLLLSVRLLDDAQKTCQLALKTDPSNSTARDCLEQWASMTVDNQLDDAE